MTQESAGLQPVSQSALDTEPQLEAWQVARESVAAQVEAERDHVLHAHALKRGRVHPESEADDFTSDELIALFTPAEISYIMRLERMSRLGNIHGASGQALLLDLWEDYQEPDWITQRPDSFPNNRDWTFTDYAGIVALSNTAMTYEYRRDFGRLVDRVFSFANAARVADREGELITPEYLVRYIGPGDLKILSQAMTITPKPEQFREVVQVMRDGEQSREQLKETVNRVIRGRLPSGTKELKMFIAHEDEGGVVHIPYRDETQLAVIRTAFGKFAEEQFLTNEGYAFVEPVKESEEGDEGL